MKPINRFEAIVDAKEKGTLESYEPLTRKEAYIKKALELGGGSGGDMFVVTITTNDDDTYSADKTFAEIEDAIQRGSSVTAVHVTEMSNMTIKYYLTLTQFVAGTVANFLNIQVIEPMNKVMFGIYGIAPDGNIIVKSHTVNLVTN